MPSLLSDITTRLASISDTPALDASVLLAHIVNKSRTWIVAHPELRLTAEQQKTLEDALIRLENGDSFPYVIGHWEFFGLDFDITPDVLIPRPETELLVEKSISWLKKNPERRSIADIGTGSGAIAISIAINISDAEILGTDISPNALQVAKRNAEKQGVGKRIQFIDCDLLPPQSSIKNRKSKIDLLCANLPYVPTETLHHLPVYGHEPTLALDGGIDGFHLIQKLMKMLPEWLAPKSLMLFEIEDSLGKQALNLAQNIFPNEKIRLHQDLTGRDRLLEIELS